MCGVTLDNVGTVLCVLCDCINFCKRRYVYSILENIELYYKHYKGIHEKRI